VKVNLVALALTRRVAAASPRGRGEEKRGASCALLTYMFSVHLRRRRETGRRIAEHRAVIDAKGFDPALLAERQRDEKAQLDQLRN
jgi:hypothetical protein